MPINCYNVFRRKAILRFVEKKIMSLENKDIKQIIGDNIAFLRKNNHWTQAELADKLNYSDKAISKWERGESSPEPEALLALSKLFNVQIDYFFYKNDVDKKRFINKKNIQKTKEILITIMICVALFTISTSVFLIAWFRDHSNANTFWISYVYAVPFSGFFIYRYMKMFNHLIGKVISLSLIMWSLLAVTFLQLMILNFA